MDKSGKMLIGPINPGQPPLFVGTLTQEAGCTELTARFHCQGVASTQTHFGIYPIYSGRREYHPIADGCLCQAIFKGRLVDENTIKGYVTPNICSCFNSDSQCNLRASVHGGQPLRGYQKQAQNYANNPQMGGLGMSWRNDFGSET